MKKLGMLGIIGGAHNIELTAAPPLTSVVAKECDAVVRTLRGSQST